MDLDSVHSFPIQGMGPGTSLAPTDDDYYDYYDDDDDDDDERMDSDFFDQYQRGELEMELSLKRNPASDSDMSPPRRHPCKYDVFLSFRGEDTRFNFVSHLYGAFDRNGIFTFKDDKRLQKGSSISPQLLNAIEDSKVALVILSPNYASSTWCLDELLKIMQCRQDMGQLVLPVFYHPHASHLFTQELYKPEESRQVFAGLY